MKEKKRHYLLLWQHYIHTQTVLEVSPQKVRFTEDDLVPIETIACTFNDAANTATDVIEKVEDGISFSTRVISHALNQGIAVIPPLTSGKYHSLTPGTLYSIKNSSTKKDRIVESVNRSYRKEPKRGWEKAAEIARETTVHLSAFLIKLTGVPRVYPRLNYVDKDLNEGNESVANISLAHEV